MFTLTSSDGLIAGKVGGGGVSVNKNFLILCFERFVVESIVVEFSGH